MNARTIVNAIIRAKASAKASANMVAYRQLVDLESKFIDYICKVGPKPEMPRKDLWPLIDAELNLICAEKH